MFADLMAFPFSQDKLMNKEPGLVADPALSLFAYIQATSVPPPIVEFTKVVDEHRWFRALVASAGITARVDYGLQNPPIDLDQERTRSLAEEGVRFMAISYFKENRYGGGFYVPDVKLSKDGEQLLVWMSDAGMVLDLSHAGHKTAHNALRFINRNRLPLRVVATHSACFDVYAHLRNLPDEILIDIVLQGGVIGLPTMTWLLDADDNTLEPLFTHIAHLLGLVGEDHIVIGSDGVYAPMDEAKDRARFAQMSRALDPDGTIFHARLPEECSLIHGANRMSVLHERIAHEFSPDIAEKITSRNLIRSFA